MEMNPQRVRSAEFKTVRKGADPEEVRVFLSDVADELERAQNQSTAMEARPRPRWPGCRNSTRRGRRPPPPRPSMPRSRSPRRSVARCCWPSARPTRRWRARGPKPSRSFAGPTTRQPRHSTRLARCRRNWSSRHASTHARSVRPSATPCRVRSRRSRPARLPRIRRPPPRDLPRRPASPGPRGGQFPARHRRPGSGWSR